MPYYENGVKVAFSIVLLLTKIQKGFIKFLEPADCGMFCPNSIAVVRYGALIRAKSPTNCDIHLAESLFQTRSRPQPFKEQENRNGKNRFCAHLGGRQ